jgi:hypothetical protein
MRFFTDYFSLFIGASHEWSEELARFSASVALPFWVQASIKGCVTYCYG